MMSLDRHCARCGAPEQDEDTKSRFLLELALSEDDPERRNEACFENFASLNHLYDVEGGAVVCWDCLTLAERRRENFQCERCGAQSHDDGSDDGGWIVELPPRPAVLCPDCVTLGEDEADTARLLAMVDAGKRQCATMGTEYPEDLAILAEGERARMDRRRAERADFDQMMEEGESS